MNYKPSLLLATIIAGKISAATIIVDDSSSVVANSIVDRITGADMSGLIVNETFGGRSGPATRTGTWTATGPDSGAAILEAFPDGTPSTSVSLAGDTSGSLAWKFDTLRVAPLLSLEFDGATAGIYFDRTNPNPGTAGSGPGADISFGSLAIPGIDATFTVTYSQPVVLVGNISQNDLYARLRIDFPRDLFFFPSAFSFTQDTDANVVPEPCGWLLASVGLTILGALKAANSSM